MKISKLNIKNFRGIKSLEIAFGGQPIFITGENGAGKSSVIYALETLLTGNNPVTGKTSLNGLTRNGATRSEVSAVIDSLGEVTRTILPTHSLTIEGRGKQKLSEAQSEITRATGSRPEDISYCLRGSSFFDKDQKDQNARWWSWLNIRIDETVIREHLAAESLPLIETLEDLGISIGRDLTRLYKSVYAERTIQNRQLKALQAEVDGLADREEPEHPRPDESVMKNLSTQQQNLNQLLGVARYREAQILKLREEVSSAPSPSTLVEAESRADAINRQIRCAEVVEEKIGQLRSIVEDKVCNACRRPNDPGVIARAQGELESLSLPDLSSLRARAEVAREYLARYGGIESKRATLDALIAESDGERSAKELGADLERVSVAIQEISAEEVAWVRYDSYVAEAEKAKADLTKVSSLVACLDRLVKLSDDKPGGIKAKILAEKKTPVEEQLSAILGNWDMAARLDDNCSLEILKEGVWRDVGSLSDGESLLVALAFQAYLCDMTGLGILVLDRFEALDRNNQDLLVTACEQLLEAGALDHVIICGVGIDRPDAINLSAGRALEVAK